MRFESERILKIIQEYIEKHGSEYESIDQAIEDAISKWNVGDLLGDDVANRSQSDDQMALDMYEKAQYIKDEEKKISLLEKAHQLDPSNLDITRDYILSTQAYHDAFRALAQIERDYLNKHRKTIREGYLVLENRPYFRLKFALVLYYYEQKLYKEAIKHAKESLKLNSNDNLGARYVLMPIYVLKFDYQNAKKLYQADEYNQFDDQLTLCMLTATVLEGKIKEGKDLAKKLLEANQNIIEFFAGEKFYPYKVEFNLPLKGHFKINSKESLALTFDQLLDLYIGSDYLYQTIRSFLKDLDQQSFDQYERELSSPQRAIELAGSGIFANIKPQYVEELLKAGFETIEDFRTASKKDILALPMIGKVTIQRLEENGVRFKDLE